MKVFVAAVFFYIRYLAFILLNFVETVVERCYGKNLIEDLKLIANKLGSKAESLRNSCGWFIFGKAADFQPVNLRKTELPRG